VTAFAKQSITHLKNRQKRTSLLILFAYLLQAIVPVGYMPASLTDSSSITKLCHAGVSASTMTALHAQHQPNATFQQNQHQQHLTQHDDRHSDWLQTCDYAASATADLGVIHSLASSDLQQSDGLLIAAPTKTCKANLVRSKQLPRAPPQTLS